MLQYVLEYYEFGVRPNLFHRIHSKELNIGSAIFFTILIDQVRNNVGTYVMDVVPRD